MKSIDMTRPVMEKIVRFEKRRSFWWLGKFFLVLLVLSSAVLWILGIAATQIAQRQTLELFMLFREDREIIAQFWRETLMTIWEELPQAKLIISAAIIVSIIILILLTRKRRMIVWNRIRQIMKYK